MKKKILAIGLAAAMSVTAVGLMAGCGTDGASITQITVAFSRPASSGTYGAFNELVVNSDGKSIDEARNDDGLDFAERGAVPQAQHPAQSCGKRGLAVFPGQHQQNFLVSPDHRTRQEETADVVDDEHLEVDQKERRASQGPSVQVLPLLMAEKRLDCLNAKLRKLCPKFPPGVLQIGQVPAAGGPNVLPRLRICRSPQRILPDNLLMGCCH